MVVILAGRPPLEIMDIRVMGMGGMGDIRMTNLISVLDGFLLNLFL